MKFDNVYEVGSRLLELIADKIMYEDLRNARKVDDIIDVILALEATGGDRRVVENLKKSIGYEKNGRIKRHINFYEIAPSKRLEPPGTLGFDKKDAIAEIIRFGEYDAEEQLADVLIKWSKKKVS